MMGIANLTTDGLRRLERVHVKAWPAFETASIEGWLWRYSGGGSQRANSVSTLDFEGADPAAALEEVESRYRGKGAPARLHTCSVGRPTHLPTLLSARGYAQGETTATMAKRLGGEPHHAEVELCRHPTPEWLEVYLGAVTENRRAVNTAILGAIPGPRAFFAYRSAGRVISTALGVAESEAAGIADDRCAVIECVATRSDSRRRGGAQAVLRAVEAWAHRQRVGLLGLQVSETNAPAIALYRHLGFAAVDRNQFWVRE
ncbi:MAG: GNAT family N-acetyltransferase [Hyphomicrobiales bacterium]